MPNGSITIYKLIILYTLSKVDSPLPPGVISDYITDRGYTNYFNLQNAFGELLEADLIKEDSTYHLTYYTLTEAGAETLELFGAPLSREIRDDECAISFLNIKKDSVKSISSFYAVFRLCNAHKILF